MLLGVQYSLAVCALNAWLLWPWQHTTANTSKRETLEPHTVMCFQSLLPFLSWLPYTFRDACGVPWGAQTGRLGLQSRQSGAMGTATHSSDELPDTFWCETRVIQYL